MKTITIILQIIIFIIKLPFILIDVIFIEIPRNIIANKWRKNAEVGDYCYFMNILGQPTIGKIEKKYKNGDVWFVTKSFCSSSSQTINLKNLYPTKESY